jgi:Uma2 family endonuclease
MAMELQRYRFTVDEYHKMGKAGIFDEDDRVELIDGEIIEMSPINPPHAWCVDYLSMLLNRSLPEDFIVRVQNPIYVDDINEPQPDVAVLKPGDYLRREQHPGPDDMILVVEVADSTVRTDRTRKVPRYAQAGIPEVWLVNLPKKVVEVYSEPVGGKYQSIMRVGRGQTLTVKILPHVTIAVDAFLR